MKLDEKALGAAATALAKADFDFSDDQNRARATVTAYLAAANGGWQPIESAPELDRIWVCGWQKPSGSVIGYWWWHEDVCVNSRALEHPEATHWAVIVLPDFPPAPGEG
ncbi:MAG TPA: hypothetical protein PLO16_15740 [Acidocella sp.]|nr:hypothetical protein [Acidocella sp.]